MYYTMRYMTEYSSVEKNIKELRNTNLTKISEVNSRSDHTNSVTQRCVLGHKIRWLHLKKSMAQSFNSKVASWRCRDAPKTSSVTKVNHSVLFHFSNSTKCSPRKKIFHDSCTNLEKRWFFLFFQKYICLSIVIRHGKFCFLWLWFCN